MAPATRQVALRAGRRSIEISNPDKSLFGDEGSPRRPDLLIWDLDPPERNPGVLRDAARLLRDLLDQVGLPAFLKTTGSRGFHVVVPLDRTAPFDEARELARDVSRGSPTDSRSRCARVHDRQHPSLPGAEGRPVAGAVAPRARAGRPRRLLDQLLERTDG